MRGFGKKWLLALIPAATVMLGFSTPSLAVKPLQISWRYDPSLLPDNVTLELHNDENVALCLPRFWEDYHALDAQQAGRNLYPAYFENKSVMLWKEVNLIDGLTVIPPHKSVEAFYDLNSWPAMKRLPVSFGLTLEVYVCSELFLRSHPAPISQRSNFNFEARRLKEPDKSYER